MKSVFSIFFAVLLLTSQMGIRFATHYCGGKVFENSISLLGEDLPACNMQKSGNEDCTNHSSIQSKSCCEDNEVTLQIKDQYNTSPSIALDNNLVFVSSFTSIYVYLIRFTDCYIVNVTHYDPPVLELDIPVLIQSFLI